MLEPRLPREVYPDYDNPHVALILAPAFHVAQIYHCSLNLLLNYFRTIQIMR